MYAWMYSRMKEGSPLTRTIPFLLSIVVSAVCIGIALVMKVPEHAIAKPLPLMSPTFASSPSSMTMFIATDDDDDDDDDAVARMFDREAEEELAEPLLGGDSTSLYPDAEV